MPLTDRQLEYVDYRLKSGDNYREADCLYLFHEHPEFDKDPEIRAEISRRRLELNEQELDLKRYRIAKELLDLENINKIAPLAYQAIVDILKNPHNKNAPAIIKMILAGKIKYLEKFGENQANKDIPNDTAGFGDFNPFDKNKKAYDSSEWE